MLGEGAMIRNVGLGFRVVVSRGSLGVQGFRRGSTAEARIITHSIPLLES